MTEATAVPNKPAIGSVYYGADARRNNDSIGAGYYIYSVCS